MNLNALVAVLVAMGSCCIGWLVRSAEGPQFVSGYACDVARKERVFIECLKATRHMGGVATPGNDSDEVVSECRVAAIAVACEWTRSCNQNCILADGTVVK